MSAARVDDETFEVFGEHFGFADRAIAHNDGAVTGFSVAELGPLGNFRIPVAADTAWVILLATLLLIFTLVALLGRRKKST